MLTLIRERIIEVDPSLVKAMGSKSAHKRYKVYLACQCQREDIDDWKMLKITTARLCSQEKPDIETWRLTLYKILWPSQGHMWSKFMRWVWVCWTLVNLVSLFCDRVCGQHWYHPMCALFMEGAFGIIECRCVFCSKPCYHFSPKTSADVFHMLLLSFLKTEVGRWKPSTKIWQVNGTCKEFIIGDIQGPNMDCRDFRWQMLIWQLVRPRSKLVSFLGNKLYSFHF